MSGKPKKPAKIELFRALADAVNKVPGISGEELPIFPYNYYTVQETDGVRSILIADEKNICRRVLDTTLEDDITAFCQNKVDNTLFHMMPNDYRDFRRFWKSYTDPIPEPLPIGWADDEKPCYHRLPWPQKNPNTHAPTLFDSPTWAELISRVDNGEALCQFIGSLFFDKSYMQQYLWLVGKGGDGKGATLRFLKKALGPSCRSLIAPSQGGKSDTHWTSTLIGVRLGMFPDSNDVGFIRSGLFKMMSGGDPIQINPKNKPYYDYIPKAKYVFGSNDEPKISPEESDLRRIILCTYQPPRERTDDFEDRLWEEGGHFLRTCIYKYENACGKDHRPIAVTHDAETMRIANSFYDDFEVVKSKFFHDYDEVDNDNIIDRDKHFVSLEDFRDVIQKALPKKEHAAFRKYMRPHYRDVKLENGTKEKRYVGLGIKPQPQNEGLRLIQELTGAVHQLRDRAH